MHCIDFYGKSLRPRSFGDLSVGVSVCVCRWLTPVSPLSFSHSGVFFFFFSEAMDVLGPGGCGGFNSCDCCRAPQDLRATSSNTLTHTYTYTYTCKHSESRFKSKKTKKPKINAVPYHAEKWLWLGTLEITDKAYIISRKQPSKSTCAEFRATQLLSVQRQWKCTWPVKSSWILISIVPVFVVRRLCTRPLVISALLFRRA